MKYVRIIRTLTVGLILALLAGVLPATSALAQPSIHLSPDEGEIGDEINIYGYGFSANVSVQIYFSSDRAEVYDRLDDEVNAYERVAYTRAGLGSTPDDEIDTEFTVPTELTDGDDVEKVRGGTYYVYVTYTASPRTIRAVDEFTVISPGEITLDPKEGTVGTEVEITGEGYGDREELRVEYDGRSVDIESGDDEADRDGEFELTILVPESTAGDHTITVIGDDTGIEAEAEFTVLPKITTTPESGAAGDTITVIGTGFSGRADFHILFDNAEVVADRKTDSDGSFKVSFAALPSGPGSHYVQAVDEDGNFDRERFAIVPTTLSISPSSGHAGSEVGVNGTGFGSSKPITIKFANVHARAAATDANGSFTERFVVPSYISGNYNVTASDGVNTASATFTITVSITLGQTTGNIGTNLSISGNGFSGVVTIKYDDVVVDRTTASANGVFSTTFEIPASSAGEHIITAIDAINTVQSTFTMESVPPSVPSLFLPETGAREKSQASFDWQSVTDPSGVTYTLQIAPDSSFGNLVLEKQGLTTSQYTLAETEELSPTSKEAPYYWRVRAIDGALNESAWSTPNSFYIGFLPDWAKNTLIVIGALVAALLIFWLGMIAGRRPSGEAS